jgi:hypothetical protein
MIHTSPPAEHFATRAPGVSQRSPHPAQFRMLMSGSALLLSAAIWVACSTAMAWEPQEAHDGNPPPVDIVFGPPSLAHAGTLYEDSTYQPRPLATLATDPLVVQETVLPPLAEFPTETATPVEVPAACACGRRHSRAECCPVVGPLHHRWNHHTKPWLQATHWGYPEYFCERPFGTYARHAAHAQIANGLSDQQVLYHYDFLPGRDEALLSPRGLYELEKIVRRMQFVPVPILVQQSDRPDLDDARRRNVLSALADMNVPAEPEMVVVGRALVTWPQALPGPDGIVSEGIIVNGNLFQQTLERGGGFRTQAGIGGSGQ